MLEDAAVTIAQKEHGMRRPFRRGATTPKIGFAQMARTISKRWKEIDPEEKKELERIATIGRQQYYQEVEAWRKYMRGDLCEQNDNASNQCATHLVHDDMVPLATNMPENVPAHQDDDFQPLAFSKNVHDTNAHFIAESNQAAALPTQELGDKASHQVIENSQIMERRLSPVFHSENNTQADSNHDLKDNANANNNAATTIFVITKDEGSPEGASTAEFIANDGQNGGMKRVVSQSSLSTFSLSEQVVHPRSLEAMKMKQLANQLGDECCDFFVSLFRQ